MLQVVQWSSISHEVWSPRRLRGSSRQLARPAASSPLSLHLPEVTSKCSSSLQQRAQSELSSCPGLPGYCPRQLQTGPLTYLKPEGPNDAMLRQQQQATARFLASPAFQVMLAHCCHTRGRQQLCQHSTWSCSVGNSARGCFGHRGAAAWQLCMLRNSTTRPHPTIPQQRTATHSMETTRSSCVRNVTAAPCMLLLLLLPPPAGSCVKAAAAA